MMKRTWRVKTVSPDGRVGAVRLGIRHRLRRSFGIENPDCSVRVVHALDTHALEAPRLGPRRQVRAVYVQTLPHARAARPVRSVVGDGGVAHELRPAVGRVDHADRPRLRAHDEALRAGAVAPVAHAPEQLAVGDAGRREEHVVAGDEVVES